VAQWWSTEERGGEREKKGRGRRRREREGRGEENPFTHVKPDIHWKLPFSRHLKIMNFWACFRTHC
jgi:hypothetical protein